MDFYRLRHMMSRKEAGCRDASAIIGAIKQGTLAGIHVPGLRKVTSDRAARISPTMGFWMLIPQGQAEMCLKEPGGKPPMVL